MSLYKELRREYGKEKQVLDAETWSNVKAYGTYEMDFKNGELWTHNDKLYLLEFIKLPHNEAVILLEYYRGCERVK